MRKIKIMKDVVDWGLCVGCGACYYACDKSSVELICIDTIGIRPKFENDKCANCNECLDICPGYQIDAGRTDVKKNNTDHLIGPTLEIWEGYAADNELRYYASSGGATTALALYCLEQEKMDFVLHTGMDSSMPWINKTVQSKNRSDLLKHTGSRYAPSSPCDSLKLIDESDKECVFIGKPCDIAALALLRKQHPKLSKNIGLAIAFFCAGTPHTKATMELVEKLEIDPHEINRIRYRGEGWPGKFKVSYSNWTKEKSLTYKESWEFLQKYRPFRCNLCPDGLGELADISCGDGWHRYPDNKNFGLSLILVRTQRGREILHGAISSGYLEVVPSGKAEVFEAQGLINRRKEIFGRLFAMRLLFIPVPKFNGFSLFKTWIKNPLWIQLKILLGTFRRLIKRGLYHRNPL